ncbi:hypothetical protein PAXRUDRAFT_827063 [Paxillus rubicundulus Ve08.2h10]|uniref:Uncharacterized protein n=1 Tax=Paxillus rubicundulus Ve08.2h10 TaxID=930991 RepID=A0A0D0DYQ5_9AGAM|nr:hypothetical protein PAXRUDRAFT_827063 [Paxillus rubicundulus Ve08.2h10]
MIACVLLDVYESNTPPWGIQGSEHGWYLCSEQTLELTWATMTWHYSVTEMNEWSLACQWPFKLLPPVPIAAYMLHQGASENLRCYGTDL